MDLARLVEVAPRLFAVVVDPDVDGPHVVPTVAAWGLRYPDCVWLRYEYPPSEHRSCWCVEDTAYAVDMVRGRCGSGRLVWVSPPAIVDLS